MVSMVIPEREQAADGARWLAALRSGLDAQGCAYEVVAVENGSPRLCRQPPHSGVFWFWEAGR